MGSCVTVNEGRGVIVRAGRAVFVGKGVFVDVLIVGVSVAGTFSAAVAGRLVGVGLQPVRSKNKANNRFMDFITIIFGQRFYYAGLGEGKGTDNGMIWLI